MVFDHLKPKECKETFGRGQVRIQLPVSSKRHTFQTRKHRVFAWAMGEFEIPYEFQTHDANFWIEIFPSTYEFKIDFKLTQISNSATDDRVWAPRHVEMSPKASIQFKTLCTQLELVIFEALLGCLWLFLVISGQWEGATC